MLKGEAGSTIVSMEKTGHVGTADIYTITFNDGSTTEISLENMSAITSVEKTSSTDTEDIYTITCADGSTQTFSVLNHNADIAAMSEDIDTIDARVDNFINSVVPNTVETLWTGSIEDVGDSATLSKAVSNFDYIDLYLLGSADSKYIRVPATQTAVQIQQQNLSDDASSNFLRLWETGVSISGTTVSITKSIAWAWDDPDNSNPTVTANAQNGNPITRIDGVKVASDTPAEVTDIRVGANGITYESAGDAVRGQYTDKTDAFYNVEFNIDNVRINPDGSSAADTSCKRTGFFPCESGTKVKWCGYSRIYQGSSIMCLIAFYNASKQFISGVTQIASEAVDTYGTKEVVAPAGTALVAFSTAKASKPVYGHVFAITSDAVATKNDLYNTCNKQAAPDTVFITVGKNVRDDDGSVVTDSKRAISDKYSTTKTRAVAISGGVYRQRVCLYNQSNVYIGFISGYTDKQITIPKDALYYRMVFERVDGADMSSEDAASIKSAMVRYYQTDESLSLLGENADAAATGAKFTSVESAIIAANGDIISIDAKLGIKTSWESGYINSSGIAINDTQGIRTVQFIKAKKGSVVSCDTLVKCRVCVYSEPKASAFVSRSDAIQGATYTVANDCYIRIACNWTPPVTVTDIAALASHVHIVLLDDGNAHKSLFGSQQFYLSAATADEETKLNTKTLAELYAIYDGLCTNYPEIIRRLPDLGMDASNTYAIREYEVSLANKLVYEGEVALSGDLDIEHLTNLWSDAMENPVIGLQIGIHGNEKAPTWGAALAIKDIIESNDDYATFIKSNFTLRIIPCANPWGFENNIRRNSNNVDINRDFNSPSEDETVAIANWLYDLVGKASLIIAVHGTTGYYAYYEVNGKSPYYDVFCNQCARFTTAVQNNWSAFYGTDKAPYCYTVKTTYSGTMGELQNRIGIAGYTLETPQNYAHGNTAVWDSDLRSCKLTKDLLINALQASGEWSVNK